MKPLGLQGLLQLKKFLLLQTLEYLRLPAFNVVPLPDAIDDEIGAILDPLGNATHTALSFDLVGEDVLITGAGPIGIMAVAIARMERVFH